MLGISKANLYYQSKQDVRDESTRIMIEEALRKHPSYGHKRLSSHLGINKKRVLRVMKKYNLQPYRRRGRKPPKKAVGMADYPNLLIDTIPSYPNHIWASDFTYLWFEGSWLYVATIIDIFTRKIVGIAVSRHHDRWLVITALMSALQNYPRPEIIHSDHGTEYCSKDYQGILNEVGITPSMAGKGCPWENGYQESFYSQWKIDFGDPGRFTSLGEITAEIYKSIYYYNNQRIHTAIKMAPNALARQYDILETINRNVESLS
jgi:putative transposase